MSFHPDITRKDDISLALDTANTAIALASRQQTGNAGSVTIPNADGTSTVIGAQTGDTTVAKFVGDKTAPGKPTGVTAESHMGAVFIAWDGTLSGGIPADLKFVRFHLSYTDAGNTVESDLCDLYASGGAASPSLPVGTVVTVTARAYDDAHAADGMSTPNVSDPATLTVTVVDETVELKNSVEADIKTVSDKADAAQKSADDLKTSVTADIKTVSDKAAAAQKSADDAADANTQLRGDVNDSLSSVGTDVTNIKTDLASARTDLANAENDIDSANTRIQQTGDKVDGLTTTVSNVSGTAGSALSLATTTHQDLQSVTTKVTAAQSDASKALSQASTLSQRADSLESTLSTDYEKKGDAAATYATKSDVTQLSDSITSTVSETYATKDALAALQNIADNAIETWQGHGGPSASTAPANGWTTNAVRASHKGDLYYDIDTGFSYRYGSGDGTTYAWTLVRDTDVTTALQAAYDAQSAADKANTAISKLNADIPATYATKSEVRQTTDSITSTVSSTTNLAQNALDKATQVEQTADGLTTTVSEQAQDISDNVKTTSQVSQRVDSLNTSITQVSGKADSALANAAELIVNPGFETGDATGWVASDNWQVVQSDSHSGAYAAYVTGNNEIINVNTFTPTPGRRYRVSVWAKADGTDKPLMYKRLQGWDGSAWQYVDLGGTWTLTDSWAAYVVDWYVSASLPYVRYRFRTTFTGAAKGVWLDDVSVRDVTDAAAAQSTADAALTQASSLSQDLNGFKTTVSQTYDAKSDALGRESSLRQSIDGFKSDVANTYVDKTDAANTYATKSSLSQTSDSLTSQINSVGTTANSAMSKATSAQQSLDGFRTTVSGTYATKGQLSDTDAKASDAASSAALALANTSLMPANPGFETGDLTGWSVQGSWTVDGAGGVVHSGSYRALVRLDGSTKAIASSPIPVAAGQTLRLGVWVYCEGAFNVGVSKGDSPLTYWQTSGYAGNSAWAYCSCTLTVPSGVASVCLRVASADSTGWLRVDDATVVDITDATAALSQASSLSQDLNGFKTTVSQTYDAKSDALGRESSLRQSLEGFKTTVSSTYVDKTTADTYATKSALSQTSEQLSSQITAVGSTANSAMSKATSAQQSLDGFKTTVSGTYATKGQLSDTDAKAAGAAANADLALANARELLTNGGFETGSLDGWSSNAPWTITSDPSVAHSGSYKGYITPTGDAWVNNGKFPVTANRTYRVGIAIWPGTSGTVNVGLETGATMLASKSMAVTGGNWVVLTQDLTVSRSVQNAHLRVGIPSGLGVVRFDDATLTDVTDVANLQSNVAATYATKSALTQTGSDITSQVSATYATKGSVTDLSTTLTQTKNSLTASIQSAQDGVDGLKTVVTVDADGVHVGKKTGGSNSGYSVLVNANGSFDVVDPGGGPVARFDANGAVIGTGDESTAPVSMGRRSLPDATAIDPSGAMRASGVVESASGWKLVGQQYTSSDGNHNLLGFIADQAGSAMSIESVAASSEGSIYRLLQLSDATHVEYTSGWMLPRIRIMSVVRTLKDADRFQVMTATEVNDLLAHAWTPEANLAVGMNGDRSSNTATVIGMDYDGGLNAQLSAKATGGFRVTFAIFDIGWF